MKKFFIAIVCLFVYNIAEAQDFQKTTEFNVNVGYDILLKGNGGAFVVQPEFGKHFSKQFYLGVGTGMVTDNKFKTFAIPAFLRAEIDFPIKQVTPYISLQGGYDFGVDDRQSCVRINPSIGVKVPITKTIAFNLGFGYTRTIVDGGGANWLGLRAGLNFNSSGDGLKKFMNSLDYNIELETMTSVKQQDEEYPEELKGVLGIRFSALAPLPIKNLYTGVSIGIGCCKNTSEWSRGEDGWIASGETTEIYSSIMSRTLYKAKQLAITEKIYPFAQVDIGLGGYFEFAVSPAVGISIVTKETHSINISAGYTPLLGEGSMRIAVGYTF